MDKEERIRELEDQVKHYLHGYVGCTIGVVIIEVILLLWKVLWHDNLLLGVILMVGILIIGIILSYIMYSQYKKTLDALEAIKTDDETKNQ